MLSTLLILAIPVRDLNFFFVPLFDDRKMRQTKGNQDCIVGKGVPLTGQHITWQEQSAPYSAYFLIQQLLI